MFSPLEAVADLPLPLSEIDVTRKTHTDLENADEMVIEDCWDGTSSDQTPLSNAWTGKTTFTRIRECEPGYEYVGSRLTRMQTTTRPSNS